MTDLFVTQKLLSIECNSIRLDSPSHEIETKTVHKTLQGMWKGSRGFEDLQGVGDQRCKGLGGMRCSLHNC